MRVTGKNDWDNYKAGKKLTRAEAIRAHCFECCLQDGTPGDCGGAKSCALYSFYPYKGTKAKKAKLED
jgi:hypothetical protein